jgi:hypothetical protein
VTVSFAATESKGRKDFSTADERCCAQLEGAESLNEHSPEVRWARKCFFIKAIHLVSGGLTERTHESLLR